MRIITILMALLIAQTSLLAQSDFTSQEIKLRNGKEFKLKLHKDFEVIPAYENLYRIRFFAEAPDGRIFVTDMKNMTNNREGKVYILEDWEAKTGKFGRVVTYLEKLRNPNSVAFHTDKYGIDWVYIAETDKLTRYKYVKNSDKPKGKRQVVARFPKSGRSYRYGSWHLTRTIAFSPEGKLYVSIGSSCNSCVESQKKRATVLEMNPDGSKSRNFVTGLRNAVGLKWLNNSLYATNMGVDHLGRDAPDDTFIKLVENTNYGWAFCYQTNGKIAYDPKYLSDKLPPANCGLVPKTFAYFPPHSGPLGFDFFDDKDSDKFFKDSFLVALHGSTERGFKRGYKIVVVDKDGKQKDFITGFVGDDERFGRPCDIFKLGANSFLFTDDYSGVVYLVRKKK